MCVHVYIKWILVHLTKKTTCLKPIYPVTESPPPTSFSALCWSSCFCRVLSLACLSCCVLEWVSSLSSRSSSPCIWLNISLVCRSTCTTSWYNKDIIRVFLQLNCTFQLLRVTDLCLEVFNGAFCLLGLELLCHP